MLLPLMCSKVRTEWHLLQCSSRFLLWCAFPLCSVNANLYIFLVSVLLGILWGSRKFYRLFSCFGSIQFCGLRLCWVELVGYSLCFSNIWGFMHVKLALFARMIKQNICNPKLFWVWKCSHFGHCYARVILKFWTIEDAAIMAILIIHSLILLF